MWRSSPLAVTEGLFEPDQEQTVAAKDFAPSLRLGKTTPQPCLPRRRRPSFRSRYRLDRRWGQLFERLRRIVAQSDVLAGYWDPPASAEIRQRRRRRLVPYLVDQAVATAWPAATSSRLC